jgi:monofunctional biosynthetic peptidoglycan transglycosylase
VRAFLTKALIAFVLFPFAYAGFYLVYPNVGAMRERNPEKTSFMRYREREWRMKGEHRDIARTWVPLSRISPFVVKAVIISEDDKFWTHEGFDFEALHDAAVKDLRQKKFRYGGSTISQQLAKNLYLSPGKNLLRKLAEAILTWRIEHTLTKRRILELYLNVAEWREGVFGIEAASRAYFHKPASALSPEQSARLAVILPNPRKYRPDGSSRYVERQAQRILSIMARRGEIIEGYDEIMRGEPSTPAVNAPAPDSSGTTSNGSPPEPEPSSASDSLAVEPGKR